MARAFIRFGRFHGIPRERVIGSATGLEYTSNGHGGTITHKAAAADYLDDGPEKPVRWTVVSIKDDWATVFAA